MARLLTCRGSGDEQALMSFGAFLRRPPNRKIGSVHTYALVLCRRRARGLERSTAVSACSMLGEVEFEFST